MYMTDNFWDRVNSLIKEKGIDQQKLADLCEINYQTFRGWRTHKTYPDALKTYKIANALGVSVEYLVSGNETNIYKEKFDNLVSAIKELPVE